jgi:hypothetical protein
MMTEYRDQVLESLFDEANRELEGEAITARVMARTRNRLVKMAASAISLTLVVLLLSWYVFAMPLLEFAVMVSQFITNPLIDLGEGWLALAFLPVNNIASLSVLLAKASLMAWKKLTGTTLVR